MRTESPDRSRIVALILVVFNFLSLICIPELIKKYLPAFLKHVIR